MLGCSQRSEYEKHFRYQNIGSFQFMINIGTSQKNQIGLDFGEGENSNAPENYIKANTIGKRYDWLIFLDSRGGRSNGPVLSTFQELLIDKINHSGSTFLLISRPKYLTCFSSLVIFLRKNNFEFTNLISNLGFVDSTPKKSAILLDGLCQAESLGFQMDTKELCEWELKNGEMAQLSTCLYSDSYKNYVGNKIGSTFQEKYFINTPIIDGEKKFVRNRSPHFFSQLNESNKLVEDVVALSGGVLIDVSSSNIETFDCVHYTQNDHELIYNTIINGLNY